MRRFLFSVIASIMLVAAVPASSVARSHHKTSHHRRHHVRVHSRRFGHLNAPNSTTPTSSDAGTVANFTPNSTNTGGTLTITLADGTPVTGQVTPDTEIECQAMNSSVQTDDGGPGPSGHDSGDRGDDNGNGNDAGDQGDANDNNDEANQNCFSSLMRDAVVREAELRISDAGAIWHHVALDS